MQRSVYCKHTVIICLCQRAPVLLNTDQSGAAHIALVRTKDRRIRDGLKDI